MSMAHNVAQLDLRDLISLAGLDDDIPQVVLDATVDGGIGRRRHVDWCGTLRCISTLYRGLGGLWRPGFT
jgi:hypothetical protein